MNSLLIATRNDLTKSSNSKSLQELTIYDFMVGTYNLSLKSNLVVFTDGERYRIVKNYNDPSPTKLLSLEEFMEFLRDKITIQELV